jgi:hypothetical protein
MKSNPGDSHENETRLELKYCERCGGLWVRECGACLVYCDYCRPKMADLPVPKKQPGSARLPGAWRAKPVDFKYEIGMDATPWRTLGGVA